MSRILAFVDATPCAADVVATADALGRLLSVDVDVATVTAAATAPWLGTARARSIVGDVPQTLVEAAGAIDVVAVVVGSRATDDATKPIGHVAEHVALALAKPLVVVPPGATELPAAPVVLVPLDGTAATSAAVAEPVDRLSRGGAIIVSAHVYDEASLPALVSSPEDRRVIAEEFDAVHSGGRSDSVELGFGVAESSIPELVERVHADAVVVAWARNLAPGRAAVVRHLLDADVRIVFMPTPA